MRALWTTYHHRMPAFLEEFARCAAMQRLSHVGMNCGCEYTRVPLYENMRTRYTRYEHSVGVALIAWHYTKDKAQAVAGLLHDIATPAFAHSIDFLHGDYLRRESTEEKTSEIIDTSDELQGLLARHGLTTGQVGDYHIYPLADNDTPRLSADRLEYTLGNLFNYKICSVEEIHAFYGDIAIGKGEDAQDELAFQSAEIACAFTKEAMKTFRIFISDVDRFLMQALADVLALAMHRGVIWEEDLYDTEEAVIKKLNADHACRMQYTNMSGVRTAKEKPPEGYWLKIDAKKRYIDPLILGKGRVSAYSSEIRARMEALKNEKCQTQTQRQNLVSFFNFFAGVVLAYPDSPF